MTQTCTPLTSPLVDLWKDSFLRYSFVWEDFLCLKNVIENQNVKTHRILSVCSSGDNALFLLNYRPQKLIAIDLNFSQIAFSHLKKQALQHFEHEQFLELFWTKTGDRAFSLYNQLNHHLPSSVRNYFETRENLFKTPLSLQGRLDKYIDQFRQNALKHLWKPCDFEKMIYTESLSKQNYYFDLADKKKLKNICKIFFSKNSLIQKARSKEQFLHVSEEKTEEIFYSRFIEILKHNLISQNPYMYYFFTGKPLLNAYSHPLFHRGLFLEIKKNISALEIVHQDLESYLEQNNLNGFNFINLSNVFEYMDSDHAKAFLKLLENNLYDKGALSYWSLFVNFNISKPSLKKKALKLRDRTGFYSDFHFYQKVTCL